MNTASGTAASAEVSRTAFLVADDKAFFRDMVHTALARAGSKDVKHATTIEAAVELLNRYGQRIGGIICDWDMAPIGGLELLRMIRCRTLPNTAPRTPVIILTARADSAAVKSAMALDVNGFAVAPLSFEKLIRTVSNAINRSWVLQPASHYASVPVAATAYSAAVTQVSGKDVIKRSDAEDARAAGPAAHAAPARAPARRPASPPKDELKNVHMCILSDVRPGSILARDLHDRSGQLLLKTGTELKPSLIDRLRHVADGQDDSYHLWIGEREPR
jgi:DNA-binding NarL/FixJ family response regulator